MVFYTDILPEKYRPQIRMMLQKYGEEFIPPLSVRSGTTQKSFDESNNKNSEDYYHKMINQAFIIDVEEDMVRGFLSFIPDYSLSLKDNILVCDYISTIIVKKEYRNQNITKKMYNELFKRRSSRVYVTRTWSSNYAHLHILNSIGFTQFFNISNDRGNGIDTVYYIREKTGFEKK